MDKRVKKEGTVPKNARKELESQTGKNVVTGENFLNGDTESRTLNNYCSEGSSFTNTITS